MSVTNKLIEKRTKKLLQRKNQWIRKNDMKIMIMKTKAVIRTQILKLAMRVWKTYIKSNV